MLSEYKYCVVIPHRNVPELLVKCLKSVPELPYVHVLVIDNSDEDKKVSADIITASWGFGGLTVIEREPRNIGYIRNEALRYLREQHFSGKLVFADADDYFTSLAVDCFIQFEDSDYDLVCFVMEGRDEHGERTHNADYVNNNLMIYKEKGDLGGVKYNSGPSCGKFINMELIVNHDIWCQEFESCEDTLFSAKVGFFSEKIFVSDVPLYVYVLRGGSSVMTPTLRKARMGFVAAYDSTVWLKERSEKGYYWTQYNVIWHWMNWCHFDRKAWRFFPRVFGLCDKRSAMQGAIKVMKRKFRAKKNKMCKLWGN